MLLHKNNQLFKHVVVATSDSTKLPVAIIEKDYYATMILKQLAAKSSDCVLSGGMALVKAHSITDRFSQTIDITTSKRILSAQRKKLASTIKSIGTDIKLASTSWKDKRTGCTFMYESLENALPKNILECVSLAMSFNQLSFSHEQKDITSFVYQFLAKENMSIAQEYGLLPFSINAQSLEQLLADNVFTLCDCYLLGKQLNCAQHLYDIHKLLQRVPLTDGFKKHVHKVREQRALLPEAAFPSARKGVAVQKLLHEILAKNIYKDDYAVLASYFIHERMPYAYVCASLGALAESTIFE